MTFVGGWTGKQQEASVQVWQLLSFHRLGTLHPPLCSRRSAIDSPELGLELAAAMAHAGTLQQLVGVDAQNQPLFRPYHFKLEDKKLYRFATAADQAPQGRLWDLKPTPRRGG